MKEETKASTCEYREVGLASGTFYLRKLTTREVHCTWKVQVAAFIEKVKLKSEERK